MRAINWDGACVALNCSAPGPSLGVDDALVQVRYAGVCATDLHIFKGYMGFTGIPGHEFVGDVVEGPDHLARKRVVGEINFGCGRCAACAQGLQRHCSTRRVLGILGTEGTFAEFVGIPAANLHVVPDSISDDEAVFTEPLAAAFEILEQVHVRPTDRALVLGDGRIGLLCAEVLALTGASVTVVGKHERKLDVLKNRGIHCVLLPDWKPSKHDVVVEATGSASGMTAAMQATRPRGTLVLKSTISGNHTLSLAPLVIDEITVVGSRCGPFAPALRALEKRSVAVTPLIEKVYPLSDGVAAIAHAGRPGALKILLRCN